MPRYKKGRIGRRFKHSGKKSTSQYQQSTIKDETDTTCQPKELHDNIVRQLQWAEAWAALYIGPAEYHQEPEAREPHSHNGFKDSDNCSADAFYVLADEMHQYSPEDNLDDVVRGILHHRRYKQYSCLEKTLLEECHQLGDLTVVRTKEDAVNLVQFYDGSQLAVKLSVSVTPSLLASVSVHRQYIGHDNDFWSGLPHFFSTLTDVKKLLSKLSSYNVCLGNYEDKFTHLVPIGVGLSQAVTSGISAYREGDFGINTNGIEISSTIRSTSCSLLVSGNWRCRYCCRYRSTLRKHLSRDSLSSKPCEPQSLKLSHKTHDKIITCAQISNY